MNHLKSLIFISLTVGVILVGIPHDSLAVTKPIKVTPTLVVVTTPAVKKSVNNICHAKGTKYYAQTKKFTPYTSIQACLTSGGRLPKQ